MSVLLLAFVFDPVTPLLFLLFTILITFIFGKVMPKKWFVRFLPFIIIAFGYVWTTTIFSNPPNGVNVLTYVKFGPIEITNYGLSTGLSLGLRVLCFAALSLMFILTTDTTKFMLSLLQQCKLPPKLVYGILAGYRFLPLLKEEFTIIRNAHRIRGVHWEKGLKGRIQLVKKYTIPLLASAIRKAERTAIAMESKGFAGSKERTFYHELKISGKDWLFSLSMICIFCVCLFVSKTWFQ
ncbi:energy-coupling factor transporter transmembrane component T family protein [Heyndrickxia sp. NPDC080065]|uniref:energy-coupling factor transporter transmembrane component T family protein n=1 Tax=Heyndrickxia sp. NPDC080065 TaxID=3390568 RepID=UPI003CFC86B3